MKTLLITSLDLKPENSKGNFILRLIREFSKDSLSCIFLGCKKSIDIAHYKEVEHTSNSAPHIRFIPNKVRSVLKHAYELKRRYFEAHKIAESILKYSREHSIANIWMVADSPMSIWVATYLIKNGDIPIRLHAMEKWPYWSWKFGLNRFSSAMLEKAFNSCRIGAASFSLNSDLLVGSDNNSSADITKRSDSATSALSVSHSGPIIKIGLADEVIRADAFYGLIAALDSTYWEIEGKKVELHYWGESEIPEKRTRIIIHSAKSEVDIINGFNTCDLIYLPGFFGRAMYQSEVAAVPPVILDYLSANVPILIHAPSYSRVANLLTEFNSGVLCASNEIESIKMNIRKIIYLENKNTVKADDRMLLLSKFSSDLTSKRFLDFINV